MESKGLSLSNREQTHSSRGKKLAHFIMLRRKASNSCSQSTEKVVKQLQNKLQISALNSVRNMQFYGVQPQQPT